MTGRRLYRLLPIAVATVLPLPALAQAVSVDLGGGSTTGQIIRLVLLVTFLSLAPSLLVMVTAFTRIVIVLSFLRTAIGLQQTPPNPVLIGLALFLTAYVMQPSLQKAWDDGIAPMMADEIDPQTGVERAMVPFRDFMLAHAREQDLTLFLGMAKIDKPKVAAETPLRVLLPAFMVGELKRSFEIGFLVFIPFLVIDMVVASVLMSMGMMMLPPAMISLPFKIIFFVLVDGWSLIAGSLVQSFGPVG